MKKFVNAIRSVRLYYAWRFAKWVRDFHEVRYYVGGEISPELVSAQNFEYKLRQALAAATR